MPLYWNYQGCLCFNQNELLTKGFCFLSPEKLFPGTKDAIFVILKAIKFGTNHIFMYMNPKGFVFFFGCWLEFETNEMTEQNFSFHFLIFTSKCVWTYLFIKILKILERVT